MKHSSRDMLFCDHCGGRVDDSSSVRGKCVVCGRLLCSRCTRIKNGVNVIKKL